MEIEENRCGESLVGPCRPKNMPPQERPCGGIVTVRGYARSYSMVISMMIFAT